MMDLRKTAFMSERLVYLPLTEKQAPLILEHFDARVTQFMMPTPPHTLDETLTLVRGTVAAMAAGQHLSIGIYYRYSGEFLGAVALNNPACSTPELGVWLKCAAWGQGYGLEAVKALIAWHKRYWRAEYYLYPVDKRNGASLHLVEKLGGCAFREYSVTKVSGEVLQAVEYRIKGT